MSLAVLLTAALALPSSPALACSMFSLSFGGHAYMANNEDYVKPGFVWFVPAGKKRHGRVNLGFADRFVQGSMNEKGLAFDAAVVAEVPYEKEPGKKTPKNLIEKIMNECATVEEALPYFERYDCPHLSRTQFLFADRTGASAVVAWMPGSGLSVVRRNGPYQLITNTRLEASAFRCERYVLAERLLAEESAYDLARVRDTLDAMHQRGPQAFTSYSNVFDLSAGTVTVYNLADFENPVTYDLAAELAKGEHAYELATVFERPGALEAMRSAEPRRYQTEVPMGEAELRRFTGTYRVAGSEVEFAIELREDALVLVPPGGKVAHLYPEGSAHFRVREGGQITFHTEAEGPVRGLTLHRFGDHEATRIERGETRPFPPSRKEGPIDCKR